MSIETPSESELRRVAMDNIRNNQIGGQTDGVSPEVAKDLGYTVDAEGVKRVVEDRERTSQVETSDTAIDSLTKATSKDKDEEPIWGIPKSQDRIERRRRNLYGKKD